MDLIADMLLAAGAIGAALYCYVLARRLNRFNDLEKGVGGAVAVLSAQVDDLNKTLLAAQKTAAASTSSLGAVTERAERMARRLELHLASLHDLPDPAEPRAQASNPMNVTGRERGTDEAASAEPVSESSAAKSKRSEPKAPSSTVFKSPTPEMGSAEPKAPVAAVKPTKASAQKRQRSQNEPIFPRHSEAEAK